MAAEGLSTIPSRLYKYVNNLTVLTNSTLQIILLTIYLDEHFIDIESITKPSVLTL
tara:strand:- start:356 stop:523 length:168 start_codon:yes stop_codon:yes gene_type:complete